MSHTAIPREPEASAIEPSAEVEVFDGSVLRDLLESLAQPATVAALYRKFVENAAALIRELCEQDDAARIDTLHTLKGSAAMMGARRIANIATHLQAQWQCSPVQVGPAVQAMDAELSRFRTEVAAQLLALGASLDAHD